MKKLVLSAALIFPLLIACSSLVLSPVNYAWPVENVLRADNNGFVEEKRHSISFNIKPILVTEFNDTTNIESREIRIIRNSSGFYFITGSGFKNVYVFESEDGELSLKDKLAVSETAFQNPVFNQKESHIELRDSEKKYVLTNNDVAGE